MSVSSSASDQKEQARWGAQPEGGLGEELDNNDQDMWLRTMENAGIVPGDYNDFNDFKPTTIEVRAPPLSQLHGHGDHCELDPVDCSWMFGTESSA